MTEKEKMLAGLDYDANDPELLAEVFHCKDLCQQFNNLPASDSKAQHDFLQNLLGTCHDDTYINPPFYCDYGKQIHVGKGFFANFHWTVLDEAPVTIGDNAFIGPNVSMYTACHSTNPIERNTRHEWAKPIRIGNNCWIGGSVTVLPGVTIGNNCTIGAGSVVTHDIPDNSIAVGNPCKVIKTINL